MSQLLIGKYLNELKKLRELSGTHRESVVREAFKDLLKAWGRAHDLTFIPEYEIESKTKERRYVDGALLHTLRVPFGYWEAKDEKDDLDAEIETKFKRGYPKTNILFDDSRTAVLIQHGEEVMRCEVDDVAGLEKLLKLFFGYERPEIEAFRKAVDQFKTGLSGILCDEPYTARWARKDVWQRRTKGRFRPSYWTSCWRGVTPRRCSIQAA